MNSFKSWLEKPVSSLSERWLIIEFTVVASVLYALLVVEVFHLPLSQLRPLLPDPVDIFPLPSPEVSPWLALGYLTFLFFLGVAYEEAVFRLLPMALVLKLEKRKGQLTTSMVMAGIVSSILFGLVHGGLEKVLVQGVGGLFLFLLFLKAGGVQGKLGRAWWTSTWAHFAFDATVLLTSVYQRHRR